MTVFTASLTILTIQVFVVPLLFVYLLFPMIIVLLSSTTIRVAPLSGSGVHGDKKPVIKPLAHAKGCDHEEDDDDDGDEDDEDDDDDDETDNDDDEDEDNDDDDEDDNY